MAFRIQKQSEGHSEMLARSQSRLLLGEWIHPHDESALDRIAGVGVNNKTRFQSLCGGLPGGGRRLAQYLNEGGRG